MRNQFRLYVSHLLRYNKGVSIDFGVIMDNHWLLENIIEIDQLALKEITERICTDKKCRYPLLALRILIHAICEMDSNGRVYICAKKLAAKLDVNYDTITKCIKYLRVSDILSIEKPS